MCVCERKRENMCACERDRTKEICIKRVIVEKNNQIK